MALSTVSHMGNPTPHAPTTEGGEVVERQVVEGASVSGYSWQPDIVALLKKHEKDIGETFDSGREATIIRIMSEDRLPPHEIAIKHVLMATAAHAHDGHDWVAAEDKRLQRVLGLILDAQEAPDGLSEALQLAHHEGGRWEEIEAEIDPHTPRALKTKAGVGVVAKASFDTAAAPAQLNQVALTPNNTAPADTDTVLTEEITTAGGGLIRKQGTFGFTESTGVATLTVTFTANGTDTPLPVTINKFGIFNKATSGGTLGIATKLSSSWTPAASGDNMTLTETLPIT